MKGDSRLVLKKYKYHIFTIALLVLILASAANLFWPFVPFDLSIVPLIIGGAFVTWGALHSVIVNRKITAGIMVVLALVGTTYVGEYIAGAIVAFMMISGEFLEHITLEKTRNSVRELIRLVPATANKYIDGGYKNVSIEEIEIGDRLLIKPGERVPVDGRVVKGNAAINESALTGESMPVDKFEGDKVYIGTLSENGVIEIITEKIGNETSLGRIIQVIRQAQNNKGEKQKMADKFAAWFTPLILVICAVVWFLSNDIMRVMTILVIACPCALVLATPTAVVAAVGNAAKKGVLIKGGITIESMAKVSALCFDKTGTITEGKPKLVDIRSFGQLAEAEVLTLAAAVEQSSLHPIAKAVLERYGDKALPPVSEFSMVIGKGLQAKLNGSLIEVTNSRGLDETAITQSAAVLDYLQQQESNGSTALLVIKDGVIEGGLAVRDTIRSTVPAVIEKLKATGLNRLIMLTGDNHKTAMSIAEQAGIAEVAAALLPEDKMNYIKKLQQEGTGVVMIGDGINDAPSLVIADVGISMGVIGTDAAVEASDISLVSDNLEALPEVFMLCKKANSIIQQNIWLFAVVVNAVGVFFSSLGFLNPILAAVIHNFSSVLVLINSSRLLQYKYQG